MTKFEEEVNKYNIFERTVYLEGGPKKILIDHFKNWHSDEEFQEHVLANKNLIDVNTKLAEEIANLKSQLQQQALPVVPEDVDKAIKYLKKHNNSTWSDLGDILTEKGFSWLNDFQFKDRRFGFGGLNNKLFILSHLAITGYQVEKPQLFYLKAKELLVVGDYDHVEDLWLDCNKNFTPKKQDAHKLTQQEIDSMETGSYEQIPVPVEDGE